MKVRIVLDGYICMIFVLSALVSQQLSISARGDICDPGEFCDLNPYDAICDVCEEPFDEPCPPFCDDDSSDDDSRDGPGGGFGSGGPPDHITFQSSGSMPEIRITPSKKSGAILFDINTPSGVIPILIQPAGPELSLTPAPLLEPRPFRPPSIFSAPLPVGSGARALGFAGAFTGIADDATAASWNPAGLVQLEHPEVSTVYRYSRVKNDHTSLSENFLVDENDYDSYGLNYLTASIPFQLESFEQNIVFSANFQEAYDFESSFSAQIRDRDQERITQSADGVFTVKQIDQFIFEPSSDLRTEVEVVSEIVTRSSSRLEQQIDTDLTADLQFEKEGVIDAISLAAAMELNPRFSVGAAVNIYQDDTVFGRGIRSRTRSTFTAISTDNSRVINRRSTSGSFVATEASISGDDVLGVDKTEGFLGEVVDEQELKSSDVRIVEGEFVEENTFDDVHGLNATLGGQWIANKFLTLGVSVDLPWSADLEQTRKVTTSSMTFDESRTKVLGSESSANVVKKDAEFDFPLFWRAGAVILWNPSWYTSIDVGQMLWSDFAFQAEGEGKISPFDGSPHGENRVDDTWTVRLGTEYLWVKRRRAIPFRLGLVWEQRPAIGNPDDYYGFSMGSGFSLGREATKKKLIIDFAYSYLVANDVQTVLPEQSGLTTDTEQHQFFISGIWHF